eukprot:1601162-Rhodomonas_salina.6
MLCISAAFAHALPYTASISVMSRAGHGRRLRSGMMGSGMQCETPTAHLPRLYLSFFLFFGVLFLLTIPALLVRLCRGWYLSPRMVCGATY